MQIVVLQIEEEEYTEQRDFRVSRLTRIVLWLLPSRRPDVLWQRLFLQALHPLY